MSVDNPQSEDQRPAAQAWIAREIDTLPPGAFALVMATGIISNGLYFESQRALSNVLFAVNLIAYCWLLAASLIRTFRVPHVIWGDLIDPRQVFAFFTFVAATDVFGAGMMLRGYPAVAVAMWLIALAVWLVLIYAGFGVLTFRNTAHDADVVYGGWLIAIVGTESLAVLGCLLAPSFGTMAPLVFVLVHMLWGLGLALYGIYVTLFAQRIFFSSFEPDHITPLLWVVMGAAAISTNAGAVLIVTDSNVPFLRAMSGFVGGVTLIAWAWATWWIPLLLLLGIWKHGINRVPMRYTLTLWSLVFPLGMYALASFRLSSAAGVPQLRLISMVMVWIAFAAWLVTAMGLTLSSWRSYRAFRRATV